MNLEKITLSDFHGYPRTSSWISRHSDVAKIADYMKLIKNPNVLDAGCGNGFNSMLFAKEGLEVLGVDINLNSESKKLYKRVKNLKLENGNLENGKWAKDRNIIFNSWMMQGLDLSSYFYNGKPAPNMIVYVKSRSTGLQPGMPMNNNEINTYDTPFGFNEVDRWACLGNDNFASDENMLFDSKLVGEIIVQARKDIYDKKFEKFEEIKKTDYSKKVKPYRWEKEIPEIN